MMKNTIAFFATHKVAANLLMVLMVLVGIWAAKNLNTQVNPTIEFSYVQIMVEWPGASAEDVERQLARPIEYALHGMDHLITIDSISHQGYLSLMLKFNRETQIGAALDEVKTRVSTIRNLPEYAKSPEIRQYVFKEPIASILVTGRGDAQDLISIVREMEADLLSRGIEDIEFNGLPKREMAIQLDANSIYELGLSLDQLAGQIAPQITTIPGGKIGLGDTEKMLRSPNKNHTAMEYEGLPIRTVYEDNLSRLQDFATIELRPIKNQVEVRNQGHAAIEMQLKRNPNSDTLVSARILKEWLKKIRPELPDGVNLRVYKEYWLYVSEQISTILYNGFIGLVLLMVTLMIFLNVRVAWWVALGIPVSFAAALYGLQLAGGSINVTSLLAFILALGVVVDDAIVVSEHAVAKFNDGLSAHEAVLSGANTMAYPVLASSLTTIAAFSPILMIGGPLGQLVTTIPIVMICVIIASLVECFLVLPHHLKSSLLAVKDDDEGRFRKWFDHEFDRFRNNVFKPILHMSLNNRSITLSITAALFLASISLVAGGRVNLDFTFGFSPEYLHMNMRFAQNTSDSDKKKFMDRVEAMLVETNEEFGGNMMILHVIRDKQASFNRELEEGVLFSSIEVELHPPSERSDEVSNKQFLTSWKGKLQVPAFVVDLQTEIMGGIGGGIPPITFLVKGKELDQVK